MNAAISSPDGPSTLGAGRTSRGLRASGPRWPRPARARLALVALPLAVLSVASAIGNVLAPHLLVANPVLLAALCPRAVYLAVAAAVVPLPTFLALGLIRLAAADPSHYLLGRMHGPAVAAALGRRSAVLGRLTAWLLRVGERTSLLAVAASPTGKILMVAGAARVRPWRVALADVAGTLLQLGALYATGGSLVQALDLSPSALAIVGVGTLLLAAAGPTVFARMGSRRRTA